jgi:hypothetical protein
MLRVSTVSGSTKRSSLPLSAAAATAEREEPLTAEQERINCQFQQNPSERTLQTTSSSNAKNGGLTCGRR